MGGGGEQKQYHNKGYKQGNGKILFFKRNSSFPQHISSKSNTIKGGGFDLCFSTFYLSGEKDKKCLVLSRRVQDPSATKTELNVFPKTSTIEQRSKRTDRLGSEKDVQEGSYLQSVESGRRISQLSISSREKGWGQKASNQSKKLQ